MIFKIQCFPPCVAPKGSYFRICQKPLRQTLWRNGMNSNHPFGATHDEKHYILSVFPNIMLNKIIRMHENCIFLLYFKYIPLWRNGIYPFGATEKIEKPIKIHCFHIFLNFFCLAYSAISKKEIMYLFIFHKNICCPLGREGGVWPVKKKQRGHCPL